MSKFLRPGFVGLLFIPMIVGLCYGAEVEYPNRPVSFILPGNPGGIADLVGRSMAEYFSQSWGQPLVPINKPGGGYLIAGNVVVTSRPDGYTIGLFPVPTAIPEIYRYFQEAPYSSTDLKPICRVVNFTGILIVKSDAPWNTLKDLVEHIRKNPGMKFGITGKGGSPYLMMLTIAKKEKIGIIDVVFPSESDLVMNILGGHVPFGIVAYTSGQAQVQAGGLKVLATYAEKRFELLPQVPTFAEIGYVPGHYPNLGLYAAKDTPDLIVKKICEIAKKASEIHSYRQKLSNLGLQVAFESSDQFRDSLNRYKVDIFTNLKELGYVKM